MIGIFSELNCIVIVLFFTFSHFALSCDASNRADISREKEDRKASSCDHFSRGSDYYSKGDYPNAIKFLLLAVKNNAPEACFLLGTISDKTKKKIKKKG